MFKSLFTKYFSVMSLIIIVSFLAMGGIQMMFNSQYWVKEKRDLLSDNNTTVREIVRNNIKLDPVTGKYQLETSSVEPSINIISHTINAYIFIASAGNEGAIIHISQNARKDDVIKAASLSADIRGGIKDEYWEVGKLGGLFSGRFYTYGQPLTLEDGTVLCYIFTSTSADALGVHLRGSMQVFFLSAIGVLALAFIVVYLLTFSMVRPLRQMAAASRRFGQGDFSARVQVKGKDEIAELALAFNSMAVSLSSVESMRRSFVANVSHELKTPMTTISGFIDGILDGTIPEEKQEHYLTIVTNEVKRLSRLVKSMLDLSHVDNGDLKIKPSRFDLTEQTCNILLSFEQRINNKRVAVTGLEDCLKTTVSADLDLINQVVYNLLDNAIKFVNEDGTLTVRIYQMNGRTVFSVRNTGAGIPAQEMPHIFERFYKSDKSRSLDKNGMGLGLYIVKTIITLHNGEIAVRSVEGEFTEFEFWLPENAAYNPTLLPDNL